jgi:S1-C subfamily serine protease
LKASDVVLRVNGKEPKSVFALNRELIVTGEQRDISFQIRRGGSARNVSVRLQPEANHFNAGLIRRKAGLTLRQLTVQDARQLGLELAGGFVVTEIERDSPADQLGLKRGTIIEAIDRVVPDSLTTAAKLFGAKQTGEAVRLTLILPRPLRRAEVDLKVR